jgi:ABC-2 type transport system ATP-binding protein
VWATHLVDEVEAAHRIVLLVAGKVAAEGRPSELATRTRATDLTAAYIRLTAPPSPA